MRFTGSVKPYTNVARGRPFYMEDPREFGKKQGIIASVPFENMRTGCLEIRCNLNYEH